ncbi:radical SAM protein [Candidatus Pacearchaeota archaeon]|nr:radical SAM protein [Candidatus Pacearchaeota archaeon]
MASLLKKEYDSLAKRIVYYLMGNSCPLKCDFCFWDKRQKDVPTAFKKFIINQIVDAGFEGILFSGGDPAYCKDFLNILKYAKSKKLFVSFHTTGLNLSRNMARKLVKYVDIISLTMDGSTPQKNMIMRKKGEIFDKTNELIKLFNSLKIKVDIKTLVTKKNYGDVINIGKVIENCKVNSWFLFEFVPLKRGKIFKKDFFVSTEKYNSLCWNVKRKFPKMNLKICRAKDMPTGSCFITPKGDVFTNKENEGEVILGNLRDMDLKDLIVR